MSVGLGRQRPLVAIIGATGTGKSQVRFLPDVGQAVTDESSSSQSHWPIDTMGRSSMVMPCSSMKGCLLLPIKSHSPSAEAYLIICLAAFL